MYMYDRIYIIVGLYNTEIFHLFLIQSLIWFNKTNFQENDFLTQIINFNKIKEFGRENCEFSAIYERTFISNIYENSL